MIAGGRKGERDSYGVWDGHIQTAILKLDYQQEASPVAQMVRTPPAIQETRVRSLGQEDPWRRGWQPTPVFLPGESPGQRSLVYYSPCGCKELDTTGVTEYAHTHI